MLLIIGLGNPGIKYKNTRHNIGFRAVDEIAANFQFSIFNFQSISNTEISKGIFKNQKIILVKPQTLMNLSGIAVSNLMNFYKIKPENLLVIHDDIDLLLGKIKIIKNRGAGGHKGVQSIIDELKTKNFIRIRIGISPSQVLQNKIWEDKPKNLERSEHIPYVLDRVQKNFVRWFVLQRFNREEKRIVKKITEKACQVIELIIKQGIEKAMNKYN